ncbi:MAG: hypothetical protein ACI9Y7_002309 [Dokdonia sp.]|jgi:hypothetical protein
MKKITLLILLFSFSLLGQDITDNLLLHYKFDNNALDSSENSYHATNFGASFTEDRFGNENGAIYFDGINDYIDLPNLMELKPQLPLSFSFWIRYDSENADKRDVFNTSYEEDVSSGVYFNSSQSLGRFAVNYGDGSNSYTSNTRRTLVSNVPINTGAWHHVAVVISSEIDMKIYIDCRDLGGQYSGSGGTLQYSNTPGSIGRHDRQLGVPANHFEGALDNFRYWNRELSLQEVTLLCEEVLSITDVASTTENSIIFPNPSNGILHIQSKDKAIDYISVYNTMGQEVFKQKYQSNIDISHLHKGIYFLRLIHGNSLSETRKVIIK